MPAAGQHCAAWHFHLAAPLCLLLPRDATLQTCSTKKRAKLPFVTGFSDYIWTSTWITALFYLCMSVKMDFFPHLCQYIPSYLCIRNFFCIFSAELAHSLVCATIDWNWSQMQGDMFPPSTSRTPCTYALPRNGDNVQNGCYFDSPKSCYEHISSARSSSSKVRSKAGQRAFFSQKRAGALLCQARLPLPCLTAWKPPPVSEMLMGKTDVLIHFGEAVLVRFTMEYGLYHLLPPSKRIL